MPSEQVDAIRIFDSRATCSYNGVMASKPKKSDDLRLPVRAAKNRFSELVRQAVREKYWHQPGNRAQALKKLIGIWKDRKDIGDSTEYVRKLRKNSSRLQRFGL